MAKIVSEKQGTGRYTMSDDGIPDISERDKNVLRQAGVRLQAIESELKESLKQLFMAKAFLNEYTVHPSQFPRFIEEKTACFMTYLATSQAQPAYLYGQNMARAGLGEDTVISIGNLLRQFCLKNEKLFSGISITSLIKAIDFYFLRFLTGFIREKEKRILEEQEKMRKALEATYK